MDALTALGTTANILCSSPEKDLPSLATDNLAPTRIFGGKAQQVLLNVLKGLLPPDTEILSNYYHPQLSNENRFTKRPLELDIYIPSLSLALEYQGEQHFHHSHIFAETHSQQQQWDQYKQTLCRELGVDLIRVPYWWDREPDSLAATIHHYRPDIIPNSPPRARPILQHRDLSTFRMFSQGVSLVTHVVADCYLYIIICCFHRCKY
jgi:hypothetical protein